MHDVTRKPHGVSQIERMPAPLRWQWTCKRLLDVLVSAILLVVLFPLLTFIGVAIKLTSHGPIFYRWPVVGWGGRPLRAYKFRTMVVGADAMKQQLLEKNEATGPVFKMRNDPRVTPIGHVLRKFSLDELPQLWNVLRGDMSLVGPRPVLLYEWAQFHEWQRRKLSIKPGMICLWHLRGQPRDFDEWVKMDLEYIDNWSLWLDLKVVMGTATYVLTGRNY
jgi:lipopolysaccharide/colanic/teichoic acid biosynthesis glycosyltransferase